MFGKTKFYLFYILFNYSLVQGCTLSSDPSGCTYPQQVCTLINVLRKKVERHNRLLLHGTYGTGKSTLAKLIAKETNSEIIEVRCSELVGPYAGEASQKIIQYMEQAIEIYKRTGKRVIFHFDEADAIAHKITSQNQTNHEQRASGLQTLWQYLDKYNPSNRLASEEDEEFKKAFFFIFSTNRYKDLESVFVSRFQRVIKLENPDSAKRKKMAKFYAIESNISARLGEKEVDKVVNRVVKKTDNMSLRSIEQVFNAIAERADACDCFKQEFVDDEIKVVADFEKERLASENATKKDSNSDLITAKQAAIHASISGVLQYTPTAVTKIVENLPKIYEYAHYYAPTLTDMTIAGSKKLVAYAWYIWSLKNGG